MPIFCADIQRIEIIENFFICPQVSQKS